MKAETELEQKLLGALGGFLAWTEAAKSDIADLVFRAAELDKAEVEAALKDCDPFSCTMWNLCNSAIGADMISHAKIHEIRSKGRTPGEPGG